MKQRILSACIAAALAITNGCAPSPPPQKPVIRVAVIGGMVMTGMWQEMAKRFEADTAGRQSSQPPGTSRFSTKRSAAARRTW